MSFLENLLWRTVNAYHHATARDVESPDTVELIQEHRLTGTVRVKTAYEAGEVDT